MDKRRYNHQGGPGWNPYWDLHWGPYHNRSPAPYMHVDPYYYMLPPPSPPYWNNIPVRHAPWRGSRGNRRRGGGNQTRQTPQKQHRGRSYDASAQRRLEKQMRKETEEAKRKTSNYGDTHGELQVRDTTEPKQVTAVPHIEDLEDDMCWAILMCSSDTSVNQCPKIDHHVTEELKTNTEEDEEDEGHWAVSMLTWD